MEASRVRGLTSPVVSPPVLRTTLKGRIDEKPLLLCLSHLRWDFVFQRPQHLLTRAAADYRVLYVEEAVERPGADAGFERETSDGVTVLRPVVPEGLSPATRTLLLETLLERVVEDNQPAVAWYYTPMALEFSRRIRAAVTVYDNMDELALFHGADSRMRQLEVELMARADLMFTGGVSLYEAKARLHPNIHPMPSSVDVAHFGRAKADTWPEPADQVGISRPRIGFFGVIDERMDMALVADLADERPDLQFVMVGPVVKIDPASRPQRPNLHWLGGKTYAELPAYLAGWIAGIMPFALNDATRFISPTKTPEYLAAGLPLVSTPIRDVVRPYGERGLVEIEETGSGFAAAIDRAIARAGTRTWQQAVADHLALSSWDRTWVQMRGRIAAIEPDAVRSEPLREQARA